MKKILIYFSIFSLITGCNSGSETQISASVTEGSCTNMVSGNFCTITINYNTGGGNQSLSYSPNPLYNGFISNDTFNTSFTACSQQIVTQSSGSCKVTINYTTIGQDESQALVFTLGNQSTTPIAISGN